MKFACYVLGALAAAGKTVADCEAVQMSLNGHWFAPCFEKLGGSCASLFDGFGLWTDKSGFEEIGEILMDIVSERAMDISENPDGTYEVVFWA